MGIDCPCEDVRLARFIQLAAQVLGHPVNYTELGNRLIDVQPFSR